MYEVTKREQEMIDSYMLAHGWTKADLASPPEDDASSFGSHQFDYDYEEAIKLVEADRSLPLDEFTFDELHMRYVEQTEIALKYIALSDKNLSEVTLSVSPPLLPGELFLVKSDQSRYDEAKKRIDEINEAAFDKFNKFFTHMDHF